MQAERRICYVLSFGFAARTVFHTDLVARLQELGCSVAAICPGADEPAMQDLAGRLGIELLPAPKVRGWIADSYMPLRRYFFEDVRHNPALWAKHLRDVEPGKSLKQRLKGFRRFKLRLMFALNRFLGGTGIRHRLTAEREQRLYQHPAVRDLLQRLQPDLLVATYPVDPLEAFALAEARRLGIKTAVQLLSWDNITSKGRFPVLADHYLSWGPIMTQELREHYGVPANRVTETGVCHFDAHVTRIDPSLRARLLQDMGLPPGEPYLLFGMSSPYFAPHEIDVVEDLARRVAAGELGTPLNLVVRPHPQNVRGYMADESWLPRLRALQGPRVGISWPKMLESSMNWAVDESDLDCLVNLLAGCSVNLNSGSTFAIDGLCHDKPVIITFFDAGRQVPWHRSARRAADYLHLKKLVATGAVSPVFSFEELYPALKQALADPQQGQTLRRAGLLAECGPVDGGASSRIAEALRRLTPSQRLVHQDSAFSADVL